MESGHHLEMATALRWASVFVLGSAALAACSGSSDDNGPGTGGGSASGGSAGLAAGGSGGSIVGGSGGTSAGGSGGTSAGGTGAGGSGGTGAGGSGGGAAGAGGIVDAGLPDVTFAYDASEPDGFNPDASCAATVVKAELTPLDMYIMTDKSSSMIGTRWNNVKAAIIAFLNDPASSGIGVGIQYFPKLPTSASQSTCGNDGQCGAYGPCWANYCRACSVAHYSTPDVPITVLPGAITPVTNSINAITPFGGTPTGPALQGAVDYAKNWATSHPGHTTVVVMATDGDPYSCTPSDIPSISAIAATAAAGTPKVLTFVIGVGSSLTNMNAIAAAGGTTKAYLVDTSSNVTQQFVQALNDIRKKTLGCEYKMPTTDAGIIDPNKVELEWTPTNGSPSVIKRVTDATQCGTAEGWYYDNNAAPTKLLLCPASCTTIQSDPTGKVDISLGCLGS